MVCRDETTDTVIMPESNLCTCRGRSTDLHPVHGHGRRSLVRLLRENHPADGRRGELGSIRPGGSIRSAAIISASGRTCTRLSARAISTPASRDDCAELAGGLQDRKVDDRLQQWEEDRVKTPILLGSPRCGRVPNGALASISCQPPALMSFEFVSQPYQTGYDLRDFLVEVGAGTYDELDIVAAWVKASGVSVLRPDIERVRARGGRVRSVVGISLGGTSRQGLDALLSVSDELYVFHLPGRTFHPKVYRASSSAEALTLVGSHNLTAGGAVRNFEAGTLGRLSSGSSAEWIYHHGVRQFVDDLVSETATCLPVDASLIQQLSQSQRYRLADEERDDDWLQDASEAEDAATDEPATFGRTVRALRSNAGTGRTSITSAPGGRPVQERTSASAAGPSAVGGSQAGVVGSPGVVKRWFKLLGSIDAQQGSSPNWHPSNTMTLVQAGHPIEASTYFREEFFVDQNWVPEPTASGRPREVAEVQVEVFVEGQFAGDYTFKIRHTPEYEADQGNRTSELVWSEFRLHMRANDYRGKFATLERLSDGSSRLQLSAAEVGPFIR